MNTSSRALVFALFAVTAAAAIGIGQADWKVDAADEIVKLERVVVVGKRADAPVVIAQLPRVVITGRSTAPADVQMAAACTAQPLC